MINDTAIIYMLRQDLQKKYSYGNDFYSWCLLTGLSEYLILEHSRSFAKLLKSKIELNNSQLTLLQYLIHKNRPDVKKIMPLPRKYNEYLGWFYTHAVNEHAIWPFLDRKEKLVALSESNRLHRHRVTKPAINSKPIHNNLITSFGANLIGYLYGQLGIGEDLRMAAKAFIDIQIPISLINFPPGKDIPLIQGKIGLERFANLKHSYPINIFCITAEETARFYAERGSNQFRGHYNIGYWPWELSKWPQEWRMLLSLVDEIWVSTKHTYDALKKVYKGPLFLMPMAVHLGKIGISTSKNKIREHFSLPKNAKLFCFSFDLNSSIYRKNPQGCIKAFLEAFPKKEFSPSEVGLVIKTHKPKGANKDWQELKRLASKDDRIHIIEDTLTREYLLALYKSCDCFLSLHRAEGFGRGIAEALQLGLHVITTGYSGNVDFCKKPNADLVDYKLIKVGPGQYPRSNNQVWADPDISHAASLMKKFFAKKVSVKPIKKYSQFSPEVVGKRYQKRLQEIMKILKKSPKLAHPLSK